MQQLRDEKARLEQVALATAEERQRFEREMRATEQTVKDLSQQASRTHQSMGLLDSDRGCLQ